MSENISNSDNVRVTEGFGMDTVSAGGNLLSKSDTCGDTNGEIKYSANDILPNNNVCSDATVSQCSSDVECANTDEMSSPDTATSTEGINSRTPVQQCEVQSSNYEAQEPLLSRLMDESQGNSEYKLEEPVNNYNNDFEKLECNSYSDVSNGSLRKTNHKSSKAKKKLMRGRPRKALVAMYHSQISGDKNTIKIRIKKSGLAQVQLAPNKKKSGRRKKHKPVSDTDASDYESKSKRVKFVHTEVGQDSSEPEEQSPWGKFLPTNILYKIFQNVCMQEGCLPVLVRLCKVCKLWRDVAMSPGLWRKIDLNWVRERFRTDIRLHWIILNRLSLCQDLNLGEWKIRDIQSALEALSSNCPELHGINLSGWKGLNAENLNYLATEFKKLERLDLSSINSTSAMIVQPFVNMAQTMNSRLTHLILANNKIAGFTQIMASISANCPNLQLLDISNIKTFAHNTALLHVEKFQIGCPKLRVLRITNSQIWLAPATITDQVASPGFPMLEELSLAGSQEEKTTTARSIDDDGIDRILKASTKLRLLDIRGCIRLTDSGLVRVPAWDLEHLFLSACFITRTQSSGLELILQKWSHSLLEVDLAWSTATSSLDAAILALAEKGAESPLRALNLCGSSVSLEPVKAVLAKCPNLHSINLQSCRALPRGIKRLYTGNAVAELRQSLQDKPKTESNESEPEQLSTSQQTP